MDNIQKYFYLITFTSYMREASQVCRDLVEEEKKKDVVLTGGKCSIPANKLKLHKTFVQWMDDHKELRPMIETGKGDLQWERDIPPESLKNLEELAKDNFKKNMGKIIHDIYQVFIITIITITIVLTFFINIKLTITIVLVNFKLTATIFSDGAHNVLGHASGRPQEACQIQVCFKDTDEDSAFASEGADPRPDRQEGN